MAAPVSIGQVAAETNRKRRKRKPKPVHESDVADHLWEAAKAATGHPPTPARVARSTRMTAEERSARKGAKRRAVEARREGQKAGLTARALSTAPRIPLRDREDMPGSVLHTPEAVAWQAMHNDDPGSWGSVLKDAAEMFAKTGEVLVDFGTGIPTLVRDPSVLNLGIVGVSFIPGVGKVFRVLKGAGHGLAIAEQGTKVVRFRPVTTRALRYGPEAGDVVHIPGAGSRVGNLVEQAYDAAHYRLFPASSARKAGREAGRSAARRGRVFKTQAHAVRAAGKRLSPSEQGALFFYAENTSLADRMSYHATRAQTWREASLLSDEDLVTTGPLATRAKRAKQLRASFKQYAKASETLVELARNAGKYLADTPTGVVLRGDAPERLKEAWRQLEAASVTREDIIDALKPEMREALEARVGGPARAISGAEEAAGRIYMPHEFGVPGAGAGLKTIPRGVAAVVSRRGSHVRRLIGNDKNLQHAWKGELMAKGMIRTDATDLSADSLLKAGKLDALKTYRDALLKLSHETQEAADDIPVLADPSHPALDARLREMLRLMDTGQLDEATLKQMDEGLVDLLRRQTLGFTTEELGNAVRWVSKDVFDRVTTDVTQYRMLGNSGTNIFAKVTLGLIDALNDIQRFAVLYANPFGYGVTNLLGNVALQVMHQGVLAPVNVGRAFNLARKLTPEELMAFDALAGAGNVLATFGFKEAGLKNALGWYTKGIHNVVDLIPRRTALIHELRREGLGDPATIKQLLREMRQGGDQADRAWKKLDRASFRANDALIDFERLTPLERATIARLFFVMPWVKGATRYTFRFPLEHPVQAAALGYAGLKVKENQPEGPYYLEGSMMIPEWFPYVGGKIINPSTIMPFKVPFDFGRALASLGYNFSDAPTLIGEFNPLVQAGIEAVTGQDEFGRELEDGFFGMGGGPAGTLGQQIVKSSRPYTLATEFMESPEDQAGDIYPYTRGDLIARSALGAVAPREFNAKEAASRQKEIEAERKPKGPEFSSERKLAQWAKDHPDQFDQAYVPYIQKYREIADKVRAGKDALAKSEGLNGRSYLSPLQEAAVELNVLLEVRPDLFEGVSPADLHTQQREVFKKGLSKDIDKYNDALRGLLEFEDVLGSRITTIVRNAQQYLKDKAKATRLASG